MHGQRRYMDDIRDCAYIAEIWRRVADSLPANDA